MTAERLLRLEREPDALLRVLHQIYKVVRLHKLDDIYRLETGDGELTGYCVSYGWTAAAAIRDAWEKAAPVRSGR